MRRFAVTFKYRIVNMIEGVWNRDDQPTVVEATNATNAAIKIRERYARQAVTEFIVERVEPLEEIQDVITTIQRVRGLAESAPDTVNHKWDDGLSYLQYVELLDLLEAVARGERLDELKDALALPGILLS